MKFLKIAFFVLMVFSLVFVVLVVPKTLKIKKIRCLTQYGTCDEDLGKTLDEFQGKSLYQAKKGIYSFLKDSVLIKDFFIQYKIPFSIRVDVIIKKPDFAIKNLESGLYALVDKEGLVIEQKKESSLPYVLFARKIPNLGEFVDKNVLNALFLIKEIYSSYNQKEGKIVGENLEVDLPEGIKVIFPLDKDREMLMGSLKLILNRLNSENLNSKIIEAGKIETIDLRFANPVLR